MTDNFNKEELQHLMTLMNAWSEPGCEVCSAIRKKIEKMLTGNWTEISNAGGITHEVIHENH